MGKFGMRGQRRCCVCKLLQNTGVERRKKLYDEIIIGSNEC